MSNTTTLDTLWTNNQDFLINNFQNNFNHIIENYNSVRPLLKVMNQDEATAIMQIIYDYTHTLRKCLLNYDDTQLDIALVDLDELLRHNIIGLTIEIRNKMRVLSDDLEIGKAHNQLTSDPYRGQEVINTDNINWRNIETLEMIKNYMYSESVNLKNIYDECKQMVITRKG